MRSQEELLDLYDSVRYDDCDHEDHGDQDDDDDDNAVLMAITEAKNGN